MIQFKKKSCQSKTLRRKRLLKNDMHQTKTNLVSRKRSLLSVFKITTKWPLHMLGSSRPDVFPKKLLLKMSQNSQHLCQSLVLNKIACFWPVILVKTILLWVFSFEFFDFTIRMPFLQNTSGGCFCMFYENSVL